MNLMMDSSSSSVPNMSTSGHDNSTTSIYPANARSTTSYDYDYIRNATLMFFLDRLFTTSKDGKEPRSLHDLSCLFGTKGFTREMRQIVGASRTGLKKFLSSYPSLFTVVDDKVYVTQITSESSSSARDYTREAVNYFEMKLLQYGTALVPIKNLFGYRSQATQEVRHVSGQNLKEFKQFLFENDNVFVIYEDCVVLKSVICEVEASGKSKAAIQKVPEDDVIDPYLTKQFASMVEQCVRKLASPRRVPSTIKKVTTNNNNNYNNNGINTDINNHHEEEEEEEEISDTEHPVSVDDLHQCLKSQSDNELFLKMTRTHDDLKIFLRMHPKIFKRCKIANTEYVSLVPEDERKEMEVLSARNRHFPLRRTNTNDSSNLASLSYQDSSLPYDTCIHTNSMNENKSNSSSHTSNNNNSQKSISINGGDDSASIHTGQASNYNSLSSSILRDEDDYGLVMEQPVSNSNNNDNEITGESNNISEKINHHNHQLTSTNNHTPRISSLHHHQSPSSAAYSSNQCDNIKVPSSDHSASQTSKVSSSLRATAPPFVPASFKVLSPSCKCSTTTPTTINTDTDYSSLALPTNDITHLNKLSSPLSGGGGGQRSLPPHGQQTPTPVAAIRERRPIDPRAAVRSYLLQASADISTSQIRQSSSRPINQSDSDAKTFSIINDASRVVERIMASTDTVAFDCKGFDLGSNGSVTLIQLGFLHHPLNSTSSTIAHSGDGSRPNENNNSIYNASNGTLINNGASPLPPPPTNKLSVEQRTPEVCIFDLLTNPELAHCLRPLLESETILKVVHDVRNKSSALFNQSGIMLRHVFDTQVANLVIQQQETGKPAYKSRYISTSKLCDIYGDATIAKYRNTVKLKSRHISTSNSRSSRSRDVKYWCIRPLTESMIYESTVDVYCLIGGVYQSLKHEIKPEYLPLFTQLNQEGILAKIKPDEVRNVKKERKIDLEVIDLKRKLYSETNGHIVLSNREIRLLRHVELTDEVRSRIQQCRKVAKKLERLDQKAAALLDGHFGQKEGSSVQGSLSHSGEDVTNNSDVFNESDPGSASTGHNQSERQTNDDILDEDNMNESDMTNLIDSSMFDMLKDTIIESTDILDSMDLDDQSCCHCSCHQQSNEDIKEHHAGKGQSTDLVEIGIQCNLIQ